MGHDSKDTLAFTGLSGSRGQGRSRLTFVLRAGAFGVLAATVKMPGELVKHPSPVGAPWSARLGAAGIGRDDREAMPSFSRQTR